VLERIIQIIKNHENISGYKICETNTQANELFFIKKNVDMDRAKKVRHFQVTVYVDFEEEGTKYKGASTTNIHPTMSEEEMKQAIGEAAFSAKFIKNPYYPLTKPTQVPYQQGSESNFAKESLPYWMNEITKAVYKNDIFDQGGINSCEIFLNKVETRIVNSEGVDAHAVDYRCMVEFITTWKEAGEEIELYRCINCSEFESELLAEEVKDMINTCKDKAIAENTPALGTFPVILTRGAVKDFFSYYFSKCNASSVYNAKSTWKVGDLLQGTKVKGDPITMTLHPLLDNSTCSGGFDEDGFALEPVTIIEKGELKQYLADTRYAHYLKVAPTGALQNVIVEGGSHPISELQKEPHLETVAFSDFTVDDMTGDFCGEIRLAWYYDGTKRVPVTGGSIVGNINELHHQLYLSKEIQRENNFMGPRAVKLMSVTVSGMA